MNQYDLAHLLDVSVDTLKAWRTKRFDGNKLSLKPTASTGRISSYSNEDIVAWLVKNPDYKDRVLALLSTTPDPFVEQVPRALPQTLARPPEPVVTTGKAWYDIAVMSDD